MKPELERMFELIEKNDTAILVTRREDGHLVARPMARQAEDEGADPGSSRRRGAGSLEKSPAIPT